MTFAENEDYMNNIAGARGLLLASESSTAAPRLLEWPCVHAFSDARPTTALQTALQQVAFPSVTWGNFLFKSFCFAQVVTQQGIFDQGREKELQSREKECERMSSRATQAENALAEAKQVHKRIFSLGISNLRHARVL